MRTLPSRRAECGRWGEARILACKDRCNGPVRAELWVNVLLGASWLWRGCECSDLSMKGLQVNLKVRAHLLLPRRSPHLLLLIRAPQQAYSLR